MKLLGVPYKPRQLQFIVGDLVCLLLAIHLGHLLRFGPATPGVDVFTVLHTHTGASLFFMSASLLSLYLLDTYNSAFDFRRGPENIRLWAAVAVAFGAQLLAYTVFPHGFWGRGVAGLVSLSLAALLTTWRALLSRFVPPPVFRVNTLIVGAGQGAHLIARVVREQHERDRAYHIVGMYDPPRGGNRRRTDYPDDAPYETPDGPGLLGAERPLPEVVAEHGIDLVIVATRSPMSDELVEQLLTCKARGVRIERMAAVYKRLLGKVPILHLPDTWIVFSPLFADTSPFAAATERLVDIAIGLVGLLISAPVIAVAAVVIRLESTGSPFFVQERLGLNEAPFRMVKLRTMRQDAEAATGAVWSQGAADPRVTRVGRFLRRSRIDELPQFWNVLVGDMAVVGPRPERAHFVAQLKTRIPFYGLRFAVKPGLTGWAQVMYRYGATDEDAAEKLCYELYAIQDMTPLLYAVILVKTVRTVLLRPGS